MLCYPSMEKSWLRFAFVYEAIGEVPQFYGQLLIFSLQACLSQVAVRIVFASRAFNIWMQCDIASCRGSLQVEHVKCRRYMWILS